jgi:hypothetical protein
VVLKKRLAFVRSSSVGGDVADADVGVVDADVDVVDADVDVVDADVDVVVWISKACLLRWTKA